MMREMVLPILATLALATSAPGQIIRDTHDHEAHERDFSGPAVHIAQRSVNLGQVREGTTANASFLVENHGAEDLVIKDVRTTCGCTTVELTEAEKIVKPGEARDIVVSFDATRRIGIQRKPVFLTLNDPREPRATLTLVVDVVSIFKVLPAPLIHLRSTNRGDQLPPLEVFAVKPEAKLEAVSVDVPDGLLTYRQDPISDPNNGEGVRLTFRVPQQIDLGIVNSHVTISATVDGEEAQMPIRVTGEVVGDLVARPLSLQSLATTPRGHRFAPVTISTTNDSTFNILSVDAGPHIKVDHQMRQTGTTYAILAQLADTAPDGPLATSIVVHTDNTGQPILRIPLYVNVQPRYRIEPELIMLGRNAGTSRKIRVQAKPDLALDISDVSCDDPRIAANVSKRKTEVWPNVLTLDVALKGDAMPKEDFKATLEFTSNIDGAKRIRVPIEYRAAN